MRINNTVNATPVFSPSFRAGKVYNWEEDPEFPFPKSEGDTFVSSDASDKELLDDALLDIFESRNENPDLKTVFTLDSYDKKSGSSRYSLAMKGAAAIAAFYIAGAVILNALGGALANADRQKEIEKKFKEDPRALAEEFIKTMGMDKKALGSFYGIPGPYQVSGVIPGDSEIFSNNPFLGPDSRIEYSVNDFLALPGTIYEAGLDIDGDGNPEISLWADNGEGYVDISYDYDSDGEVDHRSFYDAYLAATKEADKKADSGIDLLKEKQEK